MGMLSKNKWYVQCGPSMTSWVDPHPFIESIHTLRFESIHTLLSRSTPFWEEGCGSTQDAIDGPHCKLLPYLKKVSKLEYNWLSKWYPLPNLHKMHTYVQISPTNMNVDAINIARRILVFFIIIIHVSYLQDFLSNFRIKWQLNWVKNSTFP